METKEIQKLDWKEKVQWAKAQTNIVNCRRDWDNSYYEYSDYLILWTGIPGNELETVYMGRDFLDGYSLKVDTETPVYKAYTEWRNKEVRAARKARFKQSMLFYRHHGPITAAKLARYLGPTVDRPQSSAIHNLMKTRNFKSEFRKSLSDQVLSWIRTKRSKRKYHSPLSPKQLESISRF